MKRQLSGPFVIVEIAAGLGNQLFQYAAARSLADRLGLPLLLDASWYQRSDFRSYGLNHFRIRGRTLGRIERLRLGLSARPRVRFVKRLIAASCGYLPLEPIIAEEIDLNYQELPESAEESIYMKGYWQDIRYFADNADRISQDLELVSTPEVDPDLLTRMRSSNSVCVHVRRTDYLCDQNFNICGIEYYLRAIETIAASVPDVRLFFFSDDIEWTEQNLQTGMDSTFVSPNIDSPAADLWLMSQCRHRIMANSTFSWWGAWLARSKEGMVLAPDKWYRAKENWSPVFPHWTLLATGDQEGQIAR